MPLAVRLTLAAIVAAAFVTPPAPAVLASPALAGRTFVDVVVLPSFELKKVGRFSGDVLHEVTFGPQGGLDAGEFRIFDPGDGLSVTGEYRADARGRVTFLPDEDELLDFLTIVPFTTGLARATDVSAQITKRKLKARITNDKRTGELVVGSYSLNVEFSADGRVGGAPKHWKGRLWGKGRSAAATSFGAALGKAWDMTGKLTSRFGGKRAVDPGSEGIVYVGPYDTWLDRDDYRVVLGLGSASNVSFYGRWTWTSRFLPKFENDNDRLGYEVRAHLRTHIESFVASKAKYRDGTWRVTASVAKLRIGHAPGGITVKVKIRFVILVRVGGKEKPVNGTMTYSATGTPHT